LKLGEPFALLNGVLNYNLVQKYKQKTKWNKSTYLTAMSIYF